MKIWLVGISDCESNSTICLCSTKEIAERELFKERDKLVAEWVEMSEHIKGHGFSHDIFADMRKNLEGCDYENWDNYPHERPYICEM